MVIHEPLDLEYWFQTVLAGTPEIFVLISMLAITSMSAYFKMSGITFGIFLTMFAVIMFSNGFNALLLLLVLIFAPILFWWVRRIVE